MSTIEEVREQARKLDEPLRRAGNRAAWYQTGELELIEAARKSLRALLDATEPPKPAEDEREALTDLIEDYFDGDCWRGVSSELSSVISAAGYSKGPRPITDEMVAVKTEFRVLDAPKDCDYHEGFEEGIKVGRAGSGPRPITAEDEREALVMTLYANGMAGNLHEPIRRQAVEKWADAILADGYSKGPRPITDEMVEAAEEARR